jgi:hypothetical protein
MSRTNVMGPTPFPGSGAQQCAQAGEREHRIDSTTSNAATTAARLSPLLSAYDGQRCIAFVFSLGKLGFEAFDTEERLLGVYTTQRESAAAIMRDSSCSRPAATDTVADLDDIPPFLRRSRS